MKRLQVAIASWAAVPLLACGSLLGVDEFEVTRVENACGELEAPAASGCVRIGVSRCAAGFASDARGGCVPDQPSNACPPGRFAPPGFRECGEVGSLVCSSDPFRPPTREIGVVRYVSVDAPEHGDGSAARPLRSIDDVLALEAGPVTIMLSAGEHHANLDLSDRRVRLIGVCPSKTSLVADAASPAVRFGGPSDGSSMAYLAIRGGSAGVVATGTSELELVGVWIHDVDGPGVEIGDVAGDTEQEIARDSASVTLEDVLIERVVDVGLIASGAEVSLLSSVIQAVAPLRAGGRALGLSIGPSASFDSSSPEDRAMGRLTLSYVTIAQTAQAALRVEESTASVHGSWIFDVAADALGFARGIDVRGSATSTLPTELSVGGSLIERTAEAGVRLWNASATIEQTVIREIAADAAEACSGVGIGASHGLVAEARKDPDLSIRSSVIDGVRGAGVDLEGGAARVETSRISVLDVDCPAVGLRARASGTGAGTLELLQSRVVGGSPAIDASGSEVTLQGATLACAEPALAFGAIEGAETSLCGCGDVWHRCDWRLPAAEKAAPARCEASEDTTCLRLCLQTVGNQGAVADATVWAFDRPEVGSVLTGSDGCTELVGVPRQQPFIVAAAARNYGPGMAMTTAFDEPGAEPARNTLIGLSTFQDFSALVSGASVDLRRAALLNVRVCSAPGEPGFVCAPLPGSKVELVEEPSANRLYFDRNNFPKLSLTETEGADMVFANVPPGMLRIKVITPGGERCTPNGWGWPGDETNIFRIYVEPGFTESVAEVVCAP